MTKRHTPPGRKSNAQVVVENPIGPHQRARCWGAVHAAHTSSRGAAKTRLVMSDRWSGFSSRSFLSSTLVFLRLELTQILLEPVETLHPQSAVALEPVVHLLESPWFNATGPPLRLAAANDEAGALQHLQMLGHSREAHLEGLRQLGDRGLTQRQPRQDGPPRRVGEGRESGAETVRGHRLMYQMVK